MRGLVTQGQNTTPMIVQTDFPDHWKTLLVIRATGSEAAVRAILRLWAHCQRRRRWVFPELTPVMLAAICGWDGDAQMFWDAMIGTFIDATTGGFEAHGWAEVNASLIGSWENGKKGGRPLKNPAQTGGLPSGKPGRNPAGTDKTRSEKSREEYSEANASSGGPADAKAPAQENKNKGRGTQEELCAYATQRGLPASDGEWLHDKMLASGWKVSNNPVKDWQALVRAWQKGSFFPSQKQGGTHNGYHQKPAAGGNRNAGTRNEDRAGQYHGTVIHSNRA